MIVVQLSGGLGNQMFQYATARALAIRHRTDLVLDSSWIEGEAGDVPAGARNYELGCFELEAPLARIEQVARLRRSVLPSRRPLLQEGGPDPLQAPDNTYLRGNWRKLDAFEEAEEQLRRDFAFRPETSEERAGLARELQESPVPTVSLHVRRLGTLEPEYYSRALDALGSGVGSVRLFVFTDDAEWCMKNLRLNEQDVVVDAARAAELHLMTLCDHHVLADSSFSWWGAWLDPSPAKIVVAPRPWLQDSPSDWVRIDRGDYQADQPPSTTTFAPVT
jgi:Glycosyl transferase family 11